MSSVYFDAEKDFLNLVSTDKKRMAMCRIECSSPAGERSAMLPRSGIQELKRILGTLDSDTEVEAALDDAQAYFTAKDIELSVRIHESKFPRYKNVLPKTARTTVLVEKAALLSALDRIKVVVGDTNKVATLSFEKSDECVLSGFSHEFGEAVEVVSCSFSGEPVNTGFIVNFLMDPVNLISTPNVSLSLDGANSHLQVRDEGKEDFLCLVAPFELDEKTDAAAE
jgi:DNA polymerase-3 subunit beta